MNDMKRNGDLNFSDTVGARSRGGGGDGGGEG